MSHLPISHEGESAEPNNRQSQQRCRTHQLQRTPQLVGVGTKQEQRFHRFPSYRTGLGIRFGLWGGLCESNSHSVPHGPSLWDSVLGDSALASPGIGFVCFFLLLGAFGFQVNPQPPTKFVSFLFGLVDWVSVFVLPSVDACQLDWRACRNLLESVLGFRF